MANVRATAPAGGVVTEHLSGCRCDQCEQLYAYAVRVCVGMNGDPETASIGVFPASAASHLAGYLTRNREAVQQREVERAKVHHLAVE